MSRFPRLDDPEPLKERRHIVQQALFYSIGALICCSLTLVALFKIITTDAGYLVMFFVFGLFSYLTTYQAQHYLRDLNKAPIVIEGEVVKKWHKGNLFFFLFPSFYIYVDDRIFSIKRDEYFMLLENDLVRVTCYPHSLTIENLERYDESDKEFVPAASGAPV